jgi:hypothetical protein
MVPAVETRQESAKAGRDRQYNHVIFGRRGQRVPTWFQLLWDHATLAKYNLP